MFVDFARANGLLIDQPIMDGRIHRCGTIEHPRSTNGSYKFEGDWGWVQAWDLHEKPVIWRAGAEETVAVIPRRDLEAIRREEARRKEEAAALAASIICSCRTATHPYLARKGFPKEAGLIDADGRLVIPMRDVRDYKRVNSVQWIDDTGAKKFLPGGAAKGSVMIIGAGQEQWFVEGYATGLSVKAALASMYRKARVIVCFSAANLSYVSSLSSGPQRFVFADNDASGTGARAAASTGLPWVIPPTVGHDANDMHQAQGVRALVDLMRAVM